MLKPILQLAYDVTSKIAAGEVVERPLNVLKELVENSIDAGSSRISVTISRGGKGLIKIEDDGCGISAENIVFATHRHTTSKIQTVNDLSNISTFGFRGEALFSISAVSHISIISKVASDKIGACVKISAGRVIEQSACHRANGTTIEIRDLFFNFPARLKFLKSDALEKNRILSVLECTMLAYPNIHFSFLDLSMVHKKTLTFPHRDTSLDRMVDIFGDKFIEKNLFSLSLQISKSIHVSGWFSRPHFFTHSKYQFWYVNGRHVSIRSLSYAVYESYRDCLPVSTHPVYLAFINIDPSLIDVNVHPSKKEVRFHCEDELYTNLVKEIRNCRTQNAFHLENIKINKSILDDSSMNEKLEKESLNTSVSQLNKEKVNWINSTQSNKTEQDHKTDMPTSKQSRLSPVLLRQNDKTEHKLEVLHEVKSNKKNQISDSFSFIDDPRLSFKILGQFDCLYILAEKQNKLLIIDQHAAHERVLYEKFRNVWDDQITLRSQNLLVPYMIHVSLSKKEIILFYIEEFRKIGFQIESFGENTFKISSIPCLLDARLLERNINSILDNLDNLKHFNFSLEDKLIHLACRFAVKDNDILPKEVLSDLLISLFNCEHPDTCPHGRPTIISFERYELDKKFKRI